ncbi:TadE/TadG family type IV pilus assembly protein [Duganella radicis]|uniref:TadE-like domain-containing protein n=1 Tax=Duganella radicis TaxID=551988 RepID=A0A6L6PFR7_9BURK|nr:TadE/TadG family type IV pilus assembly protein [Duganella radicis]MTV37956.1 hypothetical protein [Duganella radicis]
MKRQRGIVALELALILPVLLSLLASVVFYGRLAYDYEVVQKAAREGARYLSSVAAINLKNTTLANQESLLTQTIVQSALAPLGNDAATVLVTCDSVPCSALGAVPSEVSVTVILPVSNLFAGDALRLVTRRSMRYVGN